MTIIRGGKIVAEVPIEYEDLSHLCNGQTQQFQTSKNIASVIQLTYKALTYYKERDFIIILPNIIKFIRITPEINSELFLIYIKQ